MVHAKCTLITPLDSARKAGVNPLGRCVYVSGFSFARVSAKAGGWIRFLSSGSTSDGSPLARF